MRKILIICVIAVSVFAVGAIGSDRAQADWPYGFYSPAYYPPYAYSRYVCRAWWKGCGWEPGHYWNYWPNRAYYGSYGYHW
jgi:hypothetical protein